MSIPLALADAAKNCQLQDAVCTLVLKSGQLVTGKLEKDAGAVAGGTVHLKTQTGGWATVLVSEIAAVKSEPKEVWPRP